ncbi:MAG: DNA topoisomerase IV subunit A [Candidatus Porifericomitaceae bacterium WSBS_2022_MAG_OTU9]
MATKKKRSVKHAEPDLLDDAGVVAEERQPLEQFAEKAYLDYAMAVILDRALPYLADGLKPVQRRILYAMSELHLHAGAKPKKSVRTVGDVLSKYHPHSDVACYEAMVMLAQDFSCRYPLLEGQGNWGSQDDPKSFAAMRYTETRMRPYANLLLGELGQGTVEWVANFDGSLKEPVLLPAQVPNILLNGASGIAVGLATDIPPHNLSEVLHACLHIIDHDKATLADIMQYLPGPDFPTGGEIVTPRAELEAIYETGAGMLRQRGVYRLEGKQIVITELPHQVSIHRIREQIHAQIEARKLPLLSDTRDESDEMQQVRLVLVPAGGNLDPELLMAHLFATTDLESSRRVRFTVIGGNGLPQTMPLLNLLKDWLGLRLETVRRRLQHRVGEIQQKLHFLAALQAVYANLQQVINIIREAKDPQSELMQALSLDEEQVRAILGLPLRRLARLEEKKIVLEVEQLQKELERLHTTLASEARLRTLMKKELKAILNQYGDQRRTRLVERAALAKAMDSDGGAVPEDITITLSQQGWLCARRGHEQDPQEREYRQGDGLLQAVRCRSSDSIALLDMKGRCYSLAAGKIPGGRSNGVPISSMLNPPDGTEFCGCMAGTEDTVCLLASTDGYGFFVGLFDLFTRQKAGREVLRCQGDGVVALLPARLLNAGACQVAALSSSGRLLLFPAEQLPRQHKGRGVKLMALAKGETIRAVSVLGHGESLKLYRGDSSSSLGGTKLEPYHGGRARRGHLLSPKLRKCEYLVAAGRLPLLF